MQSEALNSVNRDLHFKIPMWYLQHSLRGTSVGDTSPNRFFFVFRTHRNPLPVFHMRTLMEYTVLGVDELFLPATKSLPYMTKSASLKKSLSFVKEMYAPESR